MAVVPRSWTHKHPFALAATLMAFAVLPPAASADHSVTELVSTGPTTGYPAASSGAVMASADGSRVFFNTADRLVAADTDNATDVYERSGGTTTLISTGDSGGSANSNAILAAVSSDGARVVFLSAERLSGEDEDDTTDLYERFGGVTRLISIGSVGGNGSDDVNFHVQFRGASADARHVLFDTNESLVPEDTDPYPSSSGLDLYEAFDGTTTLVPGADFDPFLKRTFRISKDGIHVFFFSDENLVPSDHDFNSDLYERVGGVTSLVSTGPVDTGGGINGATKFEISDDGNRVVFTTTHSLVPEDVDNGQTDIYERSNGTTTTLVSTSPLDTHTFPICGAGVNGLDDNCETRISGDGSRIFFFTHEALAPEDTGGYLDLYERSGGTVKLLSIGPNGGNGPVHVGHTLSISDDGSHVFFKTAESLVGTDTDALPDVYERFNNTTTLVSTGPSDTGDGYADGYGPYASPDGSRVFWQSRNPLVPEDTNNDYDIYERSAGATTLITPGTANGAGVDPSFAATTTDGARVLFTTVDPLLASDNDSCGSSGCLDVYERRVASVGPQSPVGTTAALPSFDRLSPGDVLP